MSMTVQNLVTRALTLNGVCGWGRTPGPEQSTVAFDIVNAMISSWQNQQYYLFSLLKAIYVLTAAKAIYAIGPSAGDFVTTRPIRIESAGIIIPTAGVSLRHPLEILTVDGWNAVPNQTDTSAQVRRLYDDYAWPNSSLYLHPIPSIVCSLELFTWQPLTAFAALTDVVNFPDGYERAITHGLAVESAPAFGRPVSKELALIAEQAKETLQAKNRLLFPPAPAAPVHP
jgi:hypothetical protein